MSFIKDLQFIINLISNSKQYIASPKSDLSVTPRLYKVTLKHGVSIRGFKWTMILLPSIEQFIIGKYFEIVDFNAASHAIAWP